MLVLDRPVDRPTSPPASRRETWPDAAKGVLILLVVLWHTMRKHYDELPWVPPSVELAWRSVNVVLQPVRVPLFFAVSGLLAARSVARPWRAVLRPRVLNGYWVYLVWLVLGSAFFAVGPDLSTSTAEDAGELVGAALSGGANVWYLYALAAYFVVAKTTSRLPLGLAVALAGVLAVVADLPGVVPGYGNNVDAVLRNLVFFLVPALRPGLLTALVERARWGTAGPVAAGFLALVSALEAAGLARVPGLRVLLGALGVVAGLLVAVCAARSWPVVAGRVGRLGQRTLPVYVLHLPLLALLHAAVLPLAVPDGVASALVAVVYPLLATALLTAGALALHRLLLLARLEVLFRLPASLPIMTRTRW